jgi:uncharacterized protein YecT (DUF1311 family)
LPTRNAAHCATHGTVMRQPATVRLLSAWHLSLKSKTVIVCLMLADCAVHHVTPYVPDTANAPQTADSAEASSDCLEAATSADIAICAASVLTAADREMVQALHADLRTATIFGRDALFASQRQWLLTLPNECHLPQTSVVTRSDASSCLQSSLVERTAFLQAWPAPSAPSGAIAQYVTFRAPPGAGPQPEPAFCTAFAGRAEDALRNTGTLSPTAMGFEEVAGTHGPQAAPPVSVDLYDANAFGLFQRRARGLSKGPGAPIITPVSLTQLLEAQHTANQGGRFSSFASQTGDYGSLDAFHDGARTLVLAADPWGFTTPASQGEAAHAGVWDISGAAPVPACLFDTYTRPAEPGVFDTLSDLKQWRTLLAEVRDSTDLPLGASTKRDQGQIAADADFTLLYMPLLALRQGGGNETLWLRRRHDEVLDALFAWSGRTSANKAVFDRIFALLRPAAADLVHGYQTAQALDATEARQAGGLAIMELLYQATTNIAPGLGAEPEVLPGYKPRYPIIAAPQ